MKETGDPLRVTIVTPYYPPETGGVPTLMHSIAAGLANRGVRVRVVTSDTTRGGINYRAQLARERSAVVVRRLHRVGTTGVSALLCGLRVLLDLPRHRPNVLIAGMGWPHSFVALLLKAMARIPYIAYFYSEELALPERSRWKRFLLRLAVRHCTAAVVVSRFTEQRLRALGITARRTIMLPPSIDVARFADPSPLVQEVRRRHHIEGHRVVLTVARLVERKGQDTIIRALPEVLVSVPDVRYLIVGGGSAEVKLRRLASELGVAPFVLFAGRVPDEELAAYEQLCDVFVMPTRLDPADDEVEGFGIVFLEAAAAGKPVIAGRAGGTADAVVDGETGLLVDPEDVTAVAQAMIRLLRDQELASRLGSAGQRRVEALFSAQRSTDQLLCLLHSTRSGQRQAAT